MQIRESKTFDLFKRYQIPIASPPGEAVKSRFSLTLQIDNALGKYCITVERLDKSSGSRHAKLYLDPLRQLRRYEALALLRESGWPKETWRTGADLVFNFYHFYLDQDIMFAVLSPIYIHPESGLVVAGSRLMADEDAFYRHDGMAESCFFPEHPLEKKGHSMGITYVDLGGDIVCLSAGAGSTMALADMIEYYGGKPANFIDAMGGAGLDTIKNLASLVVDRIEMEPVPKAVLMSMHLTATPMKSIITGFVDVFSSWPFTVPRLGYIQAGGAGLYQYSLKEGQDLLEGIGFKIYPRLEEAIKAAVSLVKRD